MSDLLWLADLRWCVCGRSSPGATGRVRVDHRRAPSGMVFVNRNGLRRRDAPWQHGPLKVLCSGWKWWSRLWGIRPDDGG